MPQFSDGVSMRYPSRVGGESYVLPGNIYDRKGNGIKYDSGRVLLTGAGGDFERVSSSLVKLTQNDDVCINISTSTRFESVFVTTDRSSLLESKFMQTNNDWHNVEITVVFKYLGGNDDGQIILGGRTGLSIVDPCQGFAYRAGLNLDASGGFIAKRQYAFAGNVYRRFDTTKMGSSLKGRIAAIKLVIYDTDASGEPTIDLDESKKVNIEFYGSIDGVNPFRLLKRTDDSGGWGEADACGGDAGIVGLWGGPICTVEWNGGADIEIQSISVREIDPTDSFDTMLSNLSTSIVPRAINPSSSSNLDVFGILMFYPTKPGGRQWLSTLWNNGHPRTLSTNTFDPDDSSLGFHLGSPSPTRTFVINGDGTATMPETMGDADSRRIFINGPSWLNTEMTVYSRWRTAIWKSFQLRSRSNHHGTQDLPFGHDAANDISCGFGNYLVKWSEAGDNTVSTEVEVIHDLYKRHLAENSYVVPSINVWTGHKQITRTVGNTVVVQGFMNYDIANQSSWIKQTEFVFDGTNITIDTTGHELNVSTCLDTGDPLYVTPAAVADLNGNTLWKNSGKWSWIRINGGDDIDLKFWSVREI